MSSAPNGKVAHAALGGATGGRAPASAEKPLHPGPAAKTTANPAPRPIAGLNDPVVAVVDTKNGKGKAAATTAKGGGKAPMTPEKRKQVTYLALALIVTAIVITAVTRYFSTDEEAVVVKRMLNNPNLHKVVLDGKDMTNLPFRRHVKMYQEIQDRKKDGKYLEMLKAGSITDQQYQDLLSYAWIGKQYDRMAKYFSLGEQDKKDLLGHWYDEELKDELTGKADKDPKMKRDKRKTAAIMDSFPSEEKEKLKRFHKIIKDYEEEREREAKRIRRAAAATQPAARPAEATKTPGATPGK